MLRDKLKERLPDMTGEQADKFQIFYEFLLNENEKMNLTSITKEDEVIEKHFLDSLIALDLLPCGATVIDVGTGAGFPGVPLKIMRPDICMTLLDSKKKRIGFLNELVKLIGIDVQIVDGRAEDISKLAAYSRKFDFAISRAVAPLNDLLLWTIPFLKPGGLSLMYKGPNIDDELKSCAVRAKKMRLDMDVLNRDSPWGNRRIITARTL